MKYLFLSIIFFSPLTLANIQNPMKEISCNQDKGLFFERVLTEPEFLNLRDGYNSNLLHTFAICGNLELFQWIYERKPNYFKEINAFGDTPANYLLFRENDRYFECLLSEHPEIEPFLHGLELGKNYFSFTGDGFLEPLVQGSMLGSIVGMSISRGNLICTGIGCLTGMLVFHKKTITYNKIRNKLRLRYLSSFNRFKVD